MQFLKASERLPKATYPPYLIIVRWVTKGEHLNVATMTPNQLADKLRWDIAGVYEWLDESLPASAEDEAKELYPDDNTKMWSEYTYNQMLIEKRSAHITCAGMYQGEIERLTEQNHKLMAENDTISEELGELKNITEGLPTRIINQQRDLLVAYRNKIALTPGATVEAILEMLEDDIKTLRTMDGGEIIKNITEQSNDKS